MDRSTFMKALAGVVGGAKAVEALPTDPSYSTESKDWDANGNYSPILTRTDDVPPSVSYRFTPDGLYIFDGKTTRHIP